MPGLGVNPAAETRRPTRSADPIGGPDRRRVSALVGNFSRRRYSVAMELLHGPRASAHVACAHVPADRPTPNGTACEECGSSSSLRLCASCGHVGCCDSQAGHARVHAVDVDHPVIYQMPAGTGFVWCYTDDRYVG